MSESNGAIIIYKEVLKEFLKEKTVLSEQQLDQWLFEIDERAKDVAVKVNNIYSKN